MSKFFFAFVYCPFTQHTKSSRKNLSLNKLTVQSVRLQRVSQLRDANQKKVTSQVGCSEIEEMIRTVDKNGDGRISYSEFRFLVFYFINRLLCILRWYLLYLSCSNCVIRSYFVML